MSSRDTTYLGHIAAAVSAIDTYLTGVDVRSFRETAMVKDAVLRNLEVISEASRRLSEELKARHPNVPWSGIAGAGNIYRHNYDRVDDDVVWETATGGLVEIRTVLAAEL